MARLSDIIEEMIKDMLRQNDGAATISRSVLAREVNCVPSQITYVISTRFTSDQGYLVESRRGGGGQIRIARIKRGAPTAYLMHAINSMGKELSCHQADIYLKNFVDYNIIGSKQADLLRAALSDRAMEHVDLDSKPKVRMDIMKSMMIRLLAPDGFDLRNNGGM